MTENIQIDTYKCLNYQVVKESKKELEFSETTEKMMMKFLHDEIYINYEMPHEILTDNNVNLVEEAVRHFMMSKSTRL
ncbi:hypothetical protein BDBG_17004 [Blastomyces gilchristii SLH14081]|uniref:Uncharacterized protein n=1 Tax=Blastomyces gilchristii (strain SLH14081) TaxID=559298 RepID=A0A179UMI9_BLAGS|nr:uncharacterized protein BDBG_17004 [Blastomyces gilchristii SLH14081]OAT08357.1 hypothetical protein BDBG_17004 [Blastomyces gilchristii SLH14081]